MDCSRVLRVSSGNRVTVETQEAIPPASAAVNSILLVRCSLLRSEGGGPAAAAKRTSLSLSPNSRMRCKGVDHPRLIALADGLGLVFIASSCFGRVDQFCIPVLPISSKTA